MTAVSSEGLPEEHDLPSDAENGRMCIVTRESGSPDELIRFVAAPDGTVVADLKRHLRALLARLYVHRLDETQDLLTASIA